MADKNPTSLDSKAFDFMCSGEQHHTYHIGLIKNEVVGKLYLDKSCDFASDFRNIIPKEKIVFRSRIALIFEFLFSLISRNPTVIVGIKTNQLLYLIPFSIIGKKITIHLHGQIVGIRDKRKYYIWKLLGRIFDLQIANPIFSGPGFVKSIGNVGQFEYLPEKEFQNKICLLYGSNKNFLVDESIFNQLIINGFEPKRLISESGYVSTNEIISEAKKASYTFVSLDKNHYQLSPSGRVCDLFIYQLIPVVLQDDLDTQEILEAYGLAWIGISNSLSQ